MRNLTAKCFFNESLLENFCALIERDLDEVCHCQRPNCLKSCRSLNFWQIADALDIISTPNYIFRKDEVSKNYSEKSCKNKMLNEKFRTLICRFYRKWRVRWLQTAFGKVWWNLFTIIKCKNFSSHL